jgi:hypothetical protein
MKRSVGSSELSAFHNVVDSIDVDASLPNHIFSPAFSNFLFFESDRMFVASFVDVVMDIMNREGGKVCCLLNISQTQIMEYQEAAAIFISRTVTGAEYESLLRAGGPAVAWLYRMDRYACASDVGEWCIYCEKENDIAVIGLSSEGAAKFAPDLRRLYAEPIEVIVRKSPSELLACFRLTKEWQTRLLSSYRRPAAR